MTQKKGISKDLTTYKKQLKAAKILERMININTFDDIAKDYRFYDDPADDVTYPDGSLMPLWKFKMFTTKENAEVTGLQWSLKYTDMFGVSYGSFDFYQTTQENFICIYSLKNPSHPEYICKAPCAIMCLDIHFKYPQMVAAGLHDGNVAVFDFASKRTEPIYMSNAKDGKHKAPVWQVMWANDNLDGYLNFNSISGDGRITNWTIVKSSLWFKDELQLYFKKQLKNSKLVATTMCDGARSIAYQPDNNSCFLVGTEDGVIYLATSEFSSDFLKSYVSHVSPVNKIMWNPFYPTIFLSCASEHVIYLWHKDISSPILHFDLGSSVGDVQWAPYSSTIFAAVSDCGRIFIFDLFISKFKASCTQVLDQKCQN